MFEYIKQQNYVEKKHTQGETELLTMDISF